MYKISSSFQILGIKLTLSDNLNINFKKEKLKKKYFLNYHN